MAELTFYEKLFIYFSRYILINIILLENFVFQCVCTIFEFYESFGVSSSLLDEKECKLRKEKHVDKVQNVTKQVEDWNENGRGVNKMCSGRPGWKMLSVKNPTYKKTSTRIDLSELNEMIEIDIENKLITVEPNISMGKLVNILLPLGWTLEIIPELEELTIGGLIIGAGLESSSHKFDTKQFEFEINKCKKWIFFNRFGLFEKICTLFEIVLPDGKVLTCTKDENADLFKAIPWSHGTLGFLTMVKLRIMPCKKYVKVEYYPTHSLTETIKTYERETFKSEGNLFVEGLLFSLNKGCTIVGNFSEFTENGKINVISRWYKPWFYKYVETFLDPTFGTCHIEYVPTKDYYFRHSKSSFWEQIFLVPFGNNFIFRYLFGWLLPLKLPFLKLTSYKWMRDIMTKNHMIEDFGIPIDKLKEFLIFIDKETKIYPIWLCGTRFFEENSEEGCGAFVNGYKISEMYVDVGVYGETNVNLKNETIPEKIARIERRAIEINGYKGLYADSVLTRDEFRQMFCHDLYEKMREKYKCSEAFPEIYDKVKYGVRK